MSNVLDDKGALQVVMEDYEKHKLPRILLIREMIDKGGVLSDYDMTFLKEISHDIHQYESFVEKHPEYIALYTGFVQLYSHILDVAFENEKKAREKSR